MPTRRDESGVRLTGVVLGGGGSSRLGEPKPLAVVGGRTVLERTLEVLRPLCADIVLAVSPGQDDGTPEAGLALGVHLVVDRYPSAGPLAGLEVGLAAASRRLAFAVASDHPFLSPSLVRAMAAQAAGGACDAVVLRVNGRLQPLHSVYAPAAWAPVLRQSLKAGDLSIYGILSDAIRAGTPRVRVFEEDEALSHDPEGRSLLDIDTRDRLSEARRIAAGETG